ncbi:MAG: class I SAM-dependent methyltransferase [Candidatus Bathyarchaeia archaeon]
MNKRKGTESDSHPLFGGKEMKGFATDNKHPQGIVGVRRPYKVFRLYHHSKSRLWKMLYNEPFFHDYLEHRRIREVYELADKAARRPCLVKVSNSGWATKSQLVDDEYQSLTYQLDKIDSVTGVELQGGVHHSLHWSRRYEYPYAIKAVMSVAKQVVTPRVLDCGAGLGPIQFFLASKGFDVYSMDTYLAGLELSAQKGLENGLINIQWSYGNVLRIPFPDEYFDVVQCISVLEHVVEGIEGNTDVILKGVIDEMLRVLRPKGSAILTFDVNLNSKSERRLYYREYESLCRVLGIQATEPPADKLFSSDSAEGRIMGDDLAVFCATFTHT